MYKRSTTHPGAILREDVLPSLGISIAALSKRLGVCEQAMYAVLSEKSPITPELAVRLGTFLGNDPQLWIAMQSKYNANHLVN